MNCKSILLLTILVCISVTKIFSQTSHTDTIPYKIGFYDVKKQQNVFTIAKKIKVDPDVILQLNRLRNLQQNLVTGQRIKIPVYPKGYKYEYNPAKAEAKSKGKNKESNIDSLANAEVKQHEIEKKDATEKANEKTRIENVHTEQQRVAKLKIEEDARRNYNPEADKNNLMMVDATLELNEAMLAGIKASLDTLSKPDPELKNPNDVKEILQRMKRARDRIELKPYLDYMNDSLSLDNNKLHIEKEDILSRLTPYFEHKRVDDLQIAEHQQQELTAQATTNNTMVKPTKKTEKKQAVVAVTIIKDTLAIKKTEVVTASNSKNNNKEKEIKEPGWRDTIIVYDLGKSKGMNPAKERNQKLIAAAAHKADTIRKPVVIDTIIKQPIAEHKKSNWDTARAVIDSSLIIKQKENKKEVTQQKPVQQKITVATIKKDTVANVSVSKGKQKRDTISAAEIQRRKGNYWDTAHALVDSFALAKERLREKQQLQKQQAKRIADSLVLVRANEKKQVKTPVKIEIVTVVPKQAPVKADTITVAKLEEKKLIQKTVEPVKKADTVAVIKQEEKKTIAKTEVPFKKTDTITIAKKEEKKIAEPVKPLTKHDSIARKIEDDVMQYKARQDSVKVVAAKEALVKKDTVPTEAKSQTTKAFERKNAPADNTTNLDTIQNIKSQFFLKRAQKAIADKKNKLAEEYLNKSIELWNNNYEAWLTLADQESLFGSPAKALKQYQECARIDSSKPELSYKIASLYLQSKKKTEALQYFTKTIQLDPKYTIAYMGRASIYTDFKKYDAAIADYDKALQINKNYHYAYKARGMVKQLNKQFSEAVDDFTRYLFFEESDPSAYFYRGLAKIGNNELLEGCLDLSKSAEMGYAAAEKAIKRSCE